MKRKIVNIWCLISTLSAVLFIFLWLSKDAGKGSFSDAVKKSPQEQLDSASQDDGKTHAKFEKKLNEQALVINALKEQIAVLENQLAESKEMEMPAIEIPTSLNDAAHIFGENRRKTVDIMMEYIKKHGRPPKPGEADYEEYVLQLDALNIKSTGINALLIEKLSESLQDGTYPEKAREFLAAELAKSLELNEHQTHEIESVLEVMFQDNFDSEQTFGKSYAALSGSSSAFAEQVKGLLSDKQKLYFDMMYGNNANNLFQSNVFRPPNE